VRATQSLVCGGPILGLSRGPEPEIIAVGEPVRRSAGEGLVERAIADSDAVDGGAAIVELPAEAPADDVSATERQELDAAELRGLAVAECLPPAPTSWLVGGSTTTGRSSTIVLSNPGDVAATVDVAVWGADGPLDTAGTSGLIVPPGAQRVIPLSGIAPDEASPVVGITSRGGAVAATLQQSTIIGLEPRASTSSHRPPHRPSASSSPSFPSSTARASRWPPPGSAPSTSRPCCASSCPATRRPTSP